MDSHVHFKHLPELLARLRANPVVQVALLQMGISPKQLKYEKQRYNANSTSR